jgi:hypothetical protein
MSKTRLEFNKLSKRCLICNSKHNTIYYHVDRDNTPWLFCNRCDDSMDLSDYCALNGIEMPTDEEIARVATGIQDSNELRKIAWPSNFIPLWREEAADGVAYLKSRCIDPGDNLFYDVDKEGIVFPYYYDSTCVGAQIRFIKPKQDGTKITTVTGTRLGKLFYGWNQGDLPIYIKYVVVTEGAFNAIALQQTFNKHYGSSIKNPYKFIAASGSSIGKYRGEVLAELISEGIKVILAPDSDEAGVSMFEKAIQSNCLTHWTIAEGLGDWNDILKNNGEEALKREFLKNLKKV